MPGEHRCPTCSKSFNTASGLTSHSKAKRHNTALFVCKPCELSFLTLMALESHVNSPGHVDDSTSTMFMDGRDDCDTHCDSGDPYCHVCQRPFSDMQALNQHLFSSPEHSWLFLSETAPSRESSLADGGRDFNCPFCQRSFKSPSGIAMHIESGCHKITRHHVTAAIHAMDIVPNITIKRITGPIGPPTVHTYIATEDSFKGSAYECYLCQKLFQTLSGLNAHLNSPAHDDDEFRCPKCATEFKLISGFIQHLESGSCGLAKTTQINNYFNDLTGQFSRLLTT